VGLALSAWPYRSHLQYLGSRPVPSRERTRRTFRRHDRRDSGTLRSHSEVAPGALRLVHSRIRRGSSGVASDTPVHKSPEGDSQTIHDERDSSGWSSVSGVASGAVGRIGAPRRVHRRSPHASVTRTSRTGVPRRLGGPLPHQLTIRAQTCRPHPTSYRIAPTRRCPLHPPLPAAGPDQDATSTCDPIVYLAVPCLEPLQSIRIRYAAS